MATFVEGLFFFQRRSQALQRDADLAALSPFTQQQALDKKATDRACLPSPFKKKLKSERRTSRERVREGRWEAGRLTSLQPATVPAQGHLYKVAGGLKQKGPSNNTGEKKKNPHRFPFKQGGKKKNPTLEHSAMTRCIQGKFFPPVSESGSGTHIHRKRNRKSAVGGKKGGERERGENGVNAEAMRRRPQEGKGGERGDWWWWQ